MQCIEDVHVITYDIFFKIEYDKKLVFETTWLRYLGRGLKLCSNEEINIEC